MSFAGRVLSSFVGAADALTLPPSPGPRASAGPSIHRGIAESASSASPRMARARPRDPDPRVARSPKPVAVVCLRHADAKADHALLTTI